MSKDDFLNEFPVEESEPPERAPDTPIRTAVRLLLSHSLGSEVAFWFCGNSSRKRD